MPVQMCMNDCIMECLPLQAILRRECQHCRFPCKGTRVKPSRVKGVQMRSGESSCQRRDRSVGSDDGLWTTIRAEGALGCGENP